MLGAMEEFVGELAFGLEFAEFGGRFVEEAVGLGAGAIDGFLDSFGIGIGGVHRIEDGVSAGFLANVETNDKAGFDLAAAAQTP